MFEAKRYFFDPAQFYPQREYLMEFILSRYLAGKSEAGTQRSERGYQMAAKTTAGRLARVLDCNEGKARFLCMGVGLFFPKYGHEGITAIKQYIRDRGIRLDPERLGADVAAQCMKGGLEMAEEFYRDLCDYYAGKDTSEEMKIVRLVQQTIMDIKKTEPFYNGDPGDLLYRVTEELCILAQEHKTLKKSTILARYEEQTALCPLPALTDQQRNEIYADLDEYIRELCGYTGELEHLNHTQEEAVLICICQNDQTTKTEC